MASNAVNSSAPTSRAMKSQQKANRRDNNVLLSHHNQDYRNEIIGISGTASGQGQGLLMEHQPDGAAVVYGVNFRRGKGSGGKITSPPSGY